MRPLIVLKFGGMSLATPEHIRAAAGRVARLRASGTNVIAVVSAMGSATDALLKLAYSVSHQPNRRELDMLLSTGERVSMSLFSMALTDALNSTLKEAKAISFTGSQAGLFTDETHSNARIIDIKSIRVQEELNKGNVVILAGFQGVSPITKEITTLGRGGTDVTAVAMAAAFNATRCDILKEVPGVMSADPKALGPTDHARLLENLNHRQLLDMTFWGAKVLHYRSVELALTHKVPLRVGLAHFDDAKLDRGTLVTGDNPTEFIMQNSSFENDRTISVNSHADVRRITFLSTSVPEALGAINSTLTSQGLPLPQILNVTQESNSATSVLFTSPTESLEAQARALSAISFASPKKVQVATEALSTVTVTCQGTYTSDLAKRQVDLLKKSAIEVHSIFMSPMSLTYLVSQSQRVESVRILHGNLTF
ncbi:MAG: aspartate kinase [Deltaproteobacteria bacterium]|jgi:aspartate kinase|nr:aspartate kinase [Deltaproteobacteria bacterium]